MAACLITVSGTEGVVQLQYNIGVTPYKISAGIGTFYIEDTATDVTYTTLYGDAIASSGCLTVTALPSICYLLNWKGVEAPGYTIDALILGTEVLSINADFPRASTELAASINDLADDRVKVVQYSYTYSDPIDPSTFEYGYIIRVISDEIPILRARNSDNTAKLYIHGEVSACTILGYTDINLCYPLAIT